jgi:hypothetical protein
MKPWLLIALVFLLSACGSPQESTPAPTPQAINIIYPPSLQPWADRLSNCANKNPLVGLYIFPSAQPVMDILPNQIILELNPTDQQMESASLYQVGSEQIAIIVNQNNPLSKIKTDELRSIFSGQQKNWREESGQPIQVWVYPQGDPVRTIFDQAVMQTSPLTTEAMLAPDPSAMLEAVSENENAIGYLPESFLNKGGTVDPGKINIVQLDSSLETQLNRPVVAVTDSEPEGLIRSLLVCLTSITP